MDDIQLCKEITRLKKELQKLVSIPGEAPLLVSWGTTNAVTDCRIYVRSLDKDECAWDKCTWKSVLFTLNEPFKRVWRLCGFGSFRDW